MFEMYRSGLNGWPDCVHDSGLIIYKALRASLPIFNVVSIIESNLIS